MVERVVVVAIVVVVVVVVVHQGEPEWRGGHGLLVLLNVSSQGPGHIGEEGGGGGGGVATTTNR